MDLSPRAQIIPLLTLQDKYINIIIDPHARTLYSYVRHTHAHVRQYSSHMHYTGSCMFTPPRTHFYACICHSFDTTAVYHTRHLGYAPLLITQARVKRMRSWSQLSTLHGQRKNASGPASLACYKVHEAQHRSPYEPKLAIKCMRLVVFWTYRASSCYKVHEDGNRPKGP